MHSADSFKFLLSQVDTGKIALGSDYPFPLGEQTPGKMIKTIDGLSTEDKKNIFHRSALNWLDLDKDTFI